MKFEVLEWDSNFFNLRIGRLNVYKEDAIDGIKELLYQQKDKCYDLIYVFVPHNFKMKKLDFIKLVDEKVLYELNAQNQGTSFVDLDQISLYEGSLTDEIFSLACISGKHSRFKLDSQFPEASFSNLYRIWIEKSILKDKVYIYKEGNAILGLITLEYINNTGVIGLLGVHPNAQGKGIGKVLINKVKLDLLNAGIPRLTVATQNKNEQACRFYESVGFSVFSITDIYHCWFNK